MKTAAQILKPFYNPKRDDGRRKDLTRCHCGNFHLRVDAQGKYHIYSLSAVNSPSVKGTFVCNGTMESLREHCAELGVSPEIH